VKLPPLLYGGRAAAHADAHAYHDAAHSAPHGGADLGAEVLAVRDLDVRYPGQRECALRDVSWHISHGSRVALLGPNGSGKSTLFKAVMGLVPVVAGEIRVCGHPAGAGLPLVAYLPQRAAVDWRFPITLRRLVLTGRYVHLGWLRGPGPLDRALVEQVLEQLQLDSLAERQIGQLSGGQQQRALLGRALVQDAELLLLDEPLNAVDAETRAIVTAVLDDFQRRGRTLLLSTHDPDTMEMGFDDVLYLKAGRVAPLPRGLAIPARDGATWTG
jgi:manganese/zinc/iron transport system ATP- binding protein